MNEIKTFSSMDFGTVRIMMIEGEPWFVAKDVTDILGYQNGRRSTKNHGIRWQSREGNDNHQRVRSI